MLGFYWNLHSRPELTLTAKRKLPYAILQKLLKLTHCFKGLTGSVSYPMNPYALRTCAVGASCHVLTDLK